MTLKKYSNLTDMTADMLFKKEAIYNPYQLLRGGLLGGLGGAGIGGVVGGINAQLNDGEISNGMLRGARIGGSLGLLAGGARGHGLYAGRGAASAARLAHDNPEAFLAAMRKFKA